MLTCDAFQLIKSFQRKCTIIILPFAILDSHHIFSFFFCLAKTILGVSFDNHCIKDCCVCLWWWWKFWSWLRKHFYRVCHSKKTLKTRQMKKREIFSYKDKERKTATKGSSSKVTQVSVTSWMIWSIPPTDKKYNSLKTKPSSTVYIQIVKRLVLSYSSLVYAKVRIVSQVSGYHKVNRRKWTVDIHSTESRAHWTQPGWVKTENQFPHSTPVQLNTPEKS